MKREAKEGYTALQLGCGAKRAKQVTGTEVGHFRANGVPIKRKMQEFRVTEVRFIRAFRSLWACLRRHERSCCWHAAALIVIRCVQEGLLPVGTPLSAAHFTAGQYVDVTGTTIGKGFQGVMKRWGFAGGSASHGNSKAHRLAGSTGGCQDPGKVFPGKKMAGRMGGKRRTVLSAWLYKVLLDHLPQLPCEEDSYAEQAVFEDQCSNLHRNSDMTRCVYQVDPERNLLYVKGQVPGHKGNFVLVRDAVYKTKDQPDRPLPTIFGDLPPVTVAQAVSDPFEYAD